MDLSEQPDKTFEAFLQTLPESLKVWLKGLPDNTARAYGYWINRLLIIMKTDGEQILKDAKKDVVAVWNRAKKKADELPDSGRHMALNAIRTYLRANGIYPPADRVTSRQQEVTGEAGDPGYLTVDQVVTILKCSSHPYDYIFRLMYRAGMGAKEFLIFNTTQTWDRLKTQLKEHPEKPYFKFTYTGRKKHRIPFYTEIPTSTPRFILKAWPDVPFKTPRQVPLAMTNYRNSGKYLSLEFHEALKRAKIENAWLHVLRDSVRTEAQKAHVQDSPAEFIVGHKIADHNLYEQCWRDEDYVWTELQKLHTQLDKNEL